MPRVTGPLTTTDPADTFPTHDSLMQIGGFREVADTTARNAITTARRRAGMLVYTIADDKYWRLLPSPWTGTDSDWIAASLGQQTWTDTNGIQWAITGVTTAGALITSAISGGNPGIYNATYRATY